MNRLASTSLRTIAAAALAVLLISAPAFAECRTIPMAETPAALVRAFGARMRSTGASDWVPITQSARGPMYLAVGTDVRLAIQTEGGLAKELTLLLSEPVAADLVRLETAAAFLVARAGEVAEGEIAASISRNVTLTAREGGDRISRAGRDGVAVFSSPDRGAVAVAIGRRRCD